MYMHILAVALLLVAVAAPPAAAMPLPPPDEAHGRRLKRTDLASVRETYAHAHQSYGHVMAKFKPMIDKLLTNRMPPFLTDFMETVKGFTSDLSWVPNNPAIASMLTESVPGIEGSPGVAPLPAHLKVGPGIPKAALFRSSCGNKTLCNMIIDWVQNTNEEFRSGKTPNPLKQIAKNNEHPVELLGALPFALPPAIGDIPPLDVPMDIPPMGEIPPIGSSYAAAG